MSSSTFSSWMFEGKARCTGPGRPDWATRNAVLTVRDTISLSVSITLIFVTLRKRATWSTQRP